jgi:Asp/Glu/hydantoin racemase
MSINTTHHRSTATNPS